MTEDDDAACDRCGKQAGEDVIWSPVWGEWLCLICRAAATEAALRITLAEKQAMDARAREAS